MQMLIDFSKKASTCVSPSLKTENTHNHTTLPACYDAREHGETPAVTSTTPVPPYLQPKISSFFLGGGGGGRGFWVHL